MVNIAGYENLMPLHESANSILYRARRVGDRQPVILKLLKQDYPTPEQIRRYKQEYHLTCQLDSPGIVKAYELVEWERSYAIVLEDMGGISLKEWLSEREKLSLAEFLGMAIAITESLGQIHAQRIIHKDINPGDIVFNPETKELKIIDFGISTQLSRENPTLKNPNVLEGTLAYISPEQTGRMNRSLDYRTDFYSLGVTFYELLTQKVPYETEDALELVHCHLAKEPIAPSEIDPSIPRIISEIVLKLMAKNAEERYQSSWGLKADLENCWQQLESAGKIEVFPLANQDISDRFSIPQKLYGREAEIATLLAAFERVAETGKVELMMVAGYSGIGKSALVAEIHKPNTRLRGYFTDGKFDQFQRNIPYYAIVSALKGLMGQLLTESSSELAEWREKLLAAVGSNGQVIIDVIPEVELIIGKQPPVPELGPTESQNRFNRVFSQFIRAFCTKEHPLVIFLDDLQWADSATLKLIELMMTDSETEYLFLIGAYRDNEVSPTHPLMMTLDKLQKQGAVVNYITLAPLALEHISQLIADTLHSDRDEVKYLANLVKRKTGGNPFFANQFLKTLHDEKLIAFDFQRHVFLWDISDIEAQDITDNVVELMIGKLKKLPESTQQVLRLAACIGADFDLKTSSIICEKSQEEVFPDLVTAIKSGLILPRSELDIELLIQDYKFLHDRVQQAAYALIDEAQKTAVHLKIGRLLLQNTEHEALSEEIFKIVDHFNIGVEMVTHQAERDQIAQLNLMAGKKAKSATAYNASVTYFKVGRELLSADCWQTAYDLALSLYEEAAEAAYLCGDFRAMKQWTEIVKKIAKTIVEKVNVYNV
ncbi:MAG: AAA family ATPase [Hormoscilla sp.]